MKKTLLIIPPDYEHTFPPLGTPALCAFLKQKGILAEQMDLNLKYRDFLTGHISGFPIDTNEKKHFLGIILKKYFIEKLKGRYYSEFLPRANDGIFPYLPYENNTNSSFYFTERLLSSGYLWRYLEDGLENTFYQFYEKEKTLDFLDKGSYNLLGISVISPSQAIASLTLGALVKKHLPHIHVCIGGQWPTLYRNALSANKDFFKCFDSIIIFEGETQLFKLACAINSGRDTPEGSNIILKEASSNKYQRCISEDINLLPCPDFDDIELDIYDGNSDGMRRVTYETSRGCYWSRCAFCTDLPLPRPAYREKKPELVIRDIKQLKERYNAVHLVLGDPGISPAQMAAISELIVKEDIKISIWAMARLDPNFTSDIFRLAARAGFEQINFGFESASGRICELLNKGNRKETSLRIIRDCFNAGIKVNLQTMLGLPTETFSDGLETVDFLTANRKFINDVTFNIYYLNPSNLVYRNPDKYGIVYEKNPSLPFRYFTPFNNLRGMTENEACLLQQLYGSFLRKDKGGEKNGEISSDEILTFNKGTRLKSLEFSLNNESIKMAYLYNDENASFSLLGDREKRIADNIRKGMTVKNTYLSMLDFYAEDEIKPVFYNFIDHGIKDKIFIGNKAD